MCVEPGFRAAQCPIQHRWHLSQKCILLTRTLKNSRYFVNLLVSKEHDTSSASAKMTDLSLQQKEAIREYLRSERNFVYTFGGISFVTIIAILGGVFTFLLSEVKTSGQNAAERLITEIETDRIQPVINRFEQEYNRARDDITNERIRLVQISRDLTQAHDEIRVLVESAQSALIELELVEGRFGISAEYRDMTENIEELEQRIYELETPQAVSSPEISDDGTPLSEFLSGDG